MTHTGLTPGGRVAPSLAELARALHGQVVGRQVLAPGPGHSRRDRSLSVRPSDASPDGFIVFSHAGDDFRLCRDHVASALGLSSDRWRSAAPPDPAEVARRAEARKQAEAAERAEAEKLTRRAIAWWSEALHPAGTVVETYLRSRGLDLAPEIAGDVLRFHPACPWMEGVAPAMVAPIRSVHDGRITGLHRTALSAEGRKLGRRWYGAATEAAVMLDAFAEVASGLCVSEGIESGLAGRAVGLRPVWAMLSASNVQALPVLPGIEALTILAEHDEGGANERACRIVGTRWHEAGRAVDLAIPTVGKDLNDALVGGVAA